MTISPSTLPAPSTLSLLRAGKLAGSTRLDLSCGLTSFPAEIFTLADTLEVLNLSGNALSSLPDDLGRLHQLRVLFCSDNAFTELPAVLGQCAQLRIIGFKANRIRHVPTATFSPALQRSLHWLILTDNQISSLPAELGQCRQLQKLMLSGNRLSQLPESMAACSELQLVRIAANQFAALPDWLPDLPKLSWLAYAGNPCCDMQHPDKNTSTNDNDKTPPQDGLSDIHWDSLTLHDQLGEGASGVIYRATWNDDTTQNMDAQQLPVAVKLFKGELTSDGLPQSEMTACMSAGAHPNLIAVHGIVRQHPAGSSGLVMGLVDAAYGNLAGPPSLASCTRDIYAAGSRFNLDALSRIVCGIASAARHLHARGILHGDLYAHNMLHNTRGDCLLGDFGAASFFDLGHDASAQALQRIEVRAFACLLEELLERLVPDDTDKKTSQQAISILTALQARCAQSSNADRPLFKEIEQILQAIPTTSAV
ncbi:leucine-rich repeat-containing protein kinase family protein [soil metagenome]